MDEGLKSLEKWQKHIKVADRSEFGWATVEHYESHPLAADSDDEKRLEKAKKEAERAANKRRRGSTAAGTKKKNLSGAGPSPRPREPPVAVPPPLLPQVPARVPRVPVLGPCFSCGQYGHLAKMCPKKTVYPLNQPLVSKAESVMYPSDGCEQVSAAKVSTSEVEVKQCVDRYKTPVEVNETDSANNLEGNTDEPCWESEIKFWEIEIDGPSSQITDVQGRLKKHQKFWQEVLQAPTPVLECIENGYRLPLKFLPPPHHQHNNKSTGTHQQFVDEAVQSLLMNRCIRRVEAEPWVCSPLSVVSNSAGKLRLVLNLRYLNQFLHVTKFKYVDLRVAALMFERHEYMFKFDLKSGYHHIDIYPEHQRYLGFRWDTEDNPQFYVFVVLPFGLSTACYVFTKLLRPLVRHWRGRGLKAIIYLDDGIVAVKGKDVATEESKHVKHDLESAGFVINIEKSRWEPCNHLEWLGFQIDLCRGEFKVPQYKLDKLKVQLCEIQKAQSVPARCLASLKIMSMALALGPVTRLMTRSLYAVLNRKQRGVRNLY